MRNIPNKRFIATTMVIEFEDGPVSFSIPRGATLADISENFDRAGNRNGGLPLSINVHFKAGIDSRDGRVRAHAGLSDGTQLDVHKFCASAEQAPLFFEFLNARRAKAIENQRVD